MLSDAELDRLYEKMRAEVDESERCLKRAELIGQQIRAELAARREQPGEVIEFPRPSGDDDEPPEGGPCDQGSL